MTREEFLSGWQLLITQPWGRRYATVGTREEAKVAATQLAFYYQRMDRYSAEVWQLACEQFACGSHWPSVDEIRQTINASLPTRYQVTEQVGYDGEGEEMPEFLIRVQAYRSLPFQVRVEIDAPGITILQAAETLLPEFRAEFPDHPDIVIAEALIKRLCAHRVSVEVAQQERRYENRLRGV